MLLLTPILQWVKLYTGWQMRDFIGFRCKNKENKTWNEFSWIEVATQEVSISINPLCGSLWWLHPVHQYSNQDCGNWASVAYCTVQNTDTYQCILWTPTRWSSTHRFTSALWHSQSCKTDCHKMLHSFQLCFDVFIIWRLQSRAISPRSAKTWSDF